jgi:hypothetical protein
MHSSVRNRKWSIKKAGERSGHKYKREIPDTRGPISTKNKFVKLNYKLHQLVESRTCSENPIS